MKNKVTNRRKGKTLMKILSHFDVLPKSDKKFECHCDILSKTELKLGLKTSIESVRSLEIPLADTTPEAVTFRKFCMSKRKNLDH